MAIALLQGQSFCNDCVPGCPFLKGHPLPRISSTHPFFKGCPLSRTIVSLSQGMAASPFSRGTPYAPSTLLQRVPFLKDHSWQPSLSQGVLLSQGILSFCKDSKAKLHNWGPADVGHPVLSICFVLQDSFARVSRNTWTRAESSLFCNKAKFSCPYLWNCPLITLGHRKACDLIVAIQCS